jgi:hypothetical protein
VALILAVCLAWALAGCRPPQSPIEPVITLLPAAFEGGVVRAGRLCLGPGQSATAPLWVHGASVTFTLRGTVSGAPLLDVAIGDVAGNRVAPPAAVPLEQTYRLHPAAGRSVLRLALDPAGEGELCIGDVGLTQS